MKKTNNKLQLNKETIAKLTNDEKASIKGGEEFFSWFTCRAEVSKCARCEPLPIPNSMEGNPQTCMPETCIFLDGCY